LYIVLKGKKHGLLEHRIMSEKIFINNFIPGQEIEEEVLFVEEKTLKTARNGRTYIDLNLKDKTGNISSKIWDRVEEFDPAFAKGDFVAVRGAVEVFQEKLQLKVMSVDRIDEEQVNLDDFIDSVPVEHIEAYFSKIVKCIEEMENPHLKKLMESFLEDQEFVEKFKKCPGAKSVHHALIGGLIKHTSFMLQTAKFLTHLYRVLDADLLYTGVILHDIGKIRELQVNTSISYSVEGEMLGHAVIGLEMIREKITGIPDFPENLKILIEHMLLSHHGQADYGALRIPLFREAWMLHLVDTIDSKMEIMTKHLRDTAETGVWTEKCWPIENKKLLILERFLDSDQK
jgi:3'-5' exoribonuclease